MTIRRQSNLLWTLVAINALLALCSYLWFPPDQLAGTRGVLLPEIAVSGWQLGLANAAIILLLYGTAGKLGLSFAGKLGLIGVYRKWAGWRTWFFDPMRIGLGVGVVLVGSDRLFALFGLGERFPHPSFSLSVFASATAAIGEEILFRMFALGFCALLLDLLLWRWVGSNAILWLANLLAALAFAVAHLPATMLLTGASSPAEIPVFVLAELLLINVFLGLAAGGQYLKEGLVAAVGVHFWADIVWHLVGPMV
ncbi:MAG: CPBP family glutamic-type intramembrane protease [Chloroflexota bacterium]